MKKKLVEILQGLAFFAGICLCCCEPANAANLSGCYPEALMVQDVEYNVLRGADLVAGVNQAGEMWSWYEAYDSSAPGYNRPAIGDIYAVIMESLGTPDISDDFIIMAECAGMANPAEWVQF